MVASVVYGEWRWQPYQNLLNSVCISYKMSASVIECRSIGSCSCSGLCAGASLRHRMPVWGMKTVFNIPGSHHPGTRLRLVPWFRDPGSVLILGQVTQYGNPYIIRITTGLSVPGRYILIDRCCRSSSPWGWIQIMWQVSTGFTGEVPRAASATTQTWDRQYSFWKHRRLGSEALTVSYTQMFCVQIRTKYLDPRNPYTGFTLHGRQLVYYLFFFSKPSTDIFQINSSQLSVIRYLYFDNKLTNNQILWTNLPCLH